MCNDGDEGNEVNEREGEPSRDEDDEDSGEDGACVGIGVGLLMSVGFVEEE